MRPEKWLNAFVRSIAFLERMGDGIGTLAFIWATVVVLGGFSQYLGDAFWVGTAIVFMESFRSFSRQSRSDDQLLFKTTGGIKFKRVLLGTTTGYLYFVNTVVMTQCLWQFLNLYVSPYGFQSSAWKESHILLQLSPLAVLLILGFADWFTVHHLQGCCFDWTYYTLTPLWFIIYMLVRFGSPRDGCPLHKGVKVAACLLRAVLLAAVIWELASNLLVLFGPLLVRNLQTPMALARILLSWVWLFHKPIEVAPGNKNVEPAVKILYMMVLCQGILYLAACILESLSFLLRRSLALGCGLTDKSGMESIDLYYEQAYETSLQESLFGTTKKMGLVTFAVDCLQSDASRDKKCAAVQILDSFLQKHKTSNSNDTKLVSLITTSAKAVTTLISMLGWTVKEDADIRLFAAKVIAHIAPYLQIVGISGTIQKVSSLLDAQDQPMTREISTQIVNGNGGAHNRQISNGSSSPTVDNNGRHLGRKQTREHNGLNYSPVDVEGGNAAQAPRSTLVCQFFLFLMKGTRRFWQHLKKLQSIPHKDSNDKDSLPALGMQILEGLAQDLHNCEQICRATEIFPKIIGFISCIPGTTAVQQEEIATSSLKLIAKLASVKGKIGITLRQELTKNPFLIGNLVVILDLEGSSSNLEQSKLAMDIIAKISIDKKTRQKIGKVQVIINKLVKEFLGEDESSNPLRAEAGQALVMLALESPNNCSAMLCETNYELIEDLAGKLQCGQHIYPAASLLQSLCKNSRKSVLSHQGSNHRLSSTLTVVLGRIADAKGKQTEALIGLASQICGIMSKGVAPALDSFPDDGAFVNKMVGELNACKKPSLDEFPDMRRLLVELTVSIVESCPRYALIFKEHGMMEALSKVEQYMGLASDEQGALRAKVAWAKGLIGGNTT